MSEIITLAEQDTTEMRAQYVAHIVALLRAGDLVVLPTDGSYAVCADAFHAAAILALREVKGHDESVVLPVGGWSFDAIGGISQLGGLGRDLARAFWPGALTIITTPQPSLAWSLGDAEDALPVRVPAVGFITDVLRESGPTVMTGAQVKGAGAVTTCDEAIQALGESVALYVDGGTLSGLVSSVVDATGPHLRLLRAGAISLEQLRHVMPVIVDATASD